MNGRNPGPDDFGAYGKQPPPEIEEDDSWIEHYGNEVTLDDRVPDEAYIGPIGDFARWAGRNTDAPPLAVLATGLALVGGMLGHIPRLSYRGMETHGQPYILLIGATGSGKGISRVAWEPVLATIPMPAYDPTALITSVNSGEGMVSRLIGVTPLLDGSTPGQVFLEEFSGLLRAKNRDGSTIAQAIRESFDGRPMQRNVADRRDRGVVPKPAVAFVAHITPRELAAEHGPIDVRSGLLNRFVVIPVVRPPANDGTETFEYGVLGGRIDLAVRAARGLQAPMLPTPDAARLLDIAKAWQQRASAVGGLVGSMLERALQHVLRLAVVYAVADIEPGAITPQVEARHVLAAAAVMSAAERTTIGFWAQRPTDVREATILEKVRRAGAAGVPASTLTFGARWAYRDRLQEVIGSMLDSGVLAKTPATSGWRIHLGAASVAEGLWKDISLAMSEVGTPRTHPRSDGTDMSLHAPSVRDSNSVPTPHDSVPSVPSSGRIAVVDEDLADRATDDDAEVPTRSITEAVGPFGPDHRGITWSKPCLGRGVHWVPEDPEAGEACQVCGATIVSVAVMP